MSEADELLRSLSEPSAHLVDETTEPHFVINPDRTITVPEELKRIGVQYDHNIETVVFDCPRYWDEHDMYEMEIFINYRKPDDTLGCCLASKKWINEVDDQLMHFTWTVSGDVTEVQGYINFLVCIKCADAEGVEQNHWNSELNSDLYVTEGLECEKSVIDRDPEIIAQLLTRMQAVEDLPPTVAVEEFEGGYNVTLTDINGSQTITVLHGSVGPEGPKGDPGGTLDQNSGKYFTVFIGTRAEWETWCLSNLDIKDDTMFFPTDDTTMSDLQNEVTANTTDIADIKSDLSTMGTALSDIQSEVTANKDDIGSIKTDIADIKSDLSTMFATTAEVEAIFEEEV